MLLSDKYVPAEHNAQVLARVMPEPVEYLPSAHWRHAVLEGRPSALEYVPAKQGWQYETSGAALYPWKVPAGQLTHVELDVAPSAVEYWPSEQKVHAPTRPVPVKYMPASHLEQADKPSVFA